MSFLKELIKRRVPQIIGSYLFAGSSSVLFLAWLIDRYSLPDYYITLALFGLFAILPSVIILAFFHGSPGKDEWNRIERIGVPINIAFIIIVFAFGHYTKWWGSSSDDEILRNFFLHFSSSENYLEEYYKDYGFGSHHFYNREKYQVETISDSLLKEIRSSVFSKISGSFANHDLIIDASFYKDEQSILDKWLFHKKNVPSEGERKTLNENTSLFGDILKKRIDYYKNDGLPDALGRIFIYKVKDLERDKEYLITEFGATFGENLHNAIGNVSWSVNQIEYKIDKNGIDDLIEHLHKQTYSGINRLRYGGGRVGMVIELIDDDMVKIQMKKPGLLKNKIRVSSQRVYKWANGGGEMRIDDINQILEYMKDADLKDIWKHFQPSDPFDKEKANIMYSEGLDKYNLEIKKIKYNLINNLYHEDTSSNSDELAYYMEIVSSIDSIAIARIIGSKMPVYKVRIGDFVFIKY